MYGDDQDEWIWNDQLKVYSNIVVFVKFLIHVLTLEIMLKVVLEKMTNSPAIDIIDKLLMFFHEACLVLCVLVLLHTVFPG